MVPLEVALPPVVHEMRNVVATLSMALDLADARLARVVPGHRPLRQDAQAVLARAGTMLTDLLALARPRAVACAPTDLAALVDRVARQRPAPEGGAAARPDPRPAVHVRRAPGAPPWVMADATALSSALGHVVRNAVEAAPEGRGVIDLELAATREGWQVHVLDDGPGVADELRQALFEPFVTNKPRHLGLGLALARRAMHAQAGSLALTERAAERFGRGASFCFTLPHAPRP